MNLGFFFTSLGFVIGALVLRHQLRARNLATHGMTLLALAGFGGGIAGAKLCEWLLGHFDLWSRLPLAIFDPRFGGRTIIGGVICGWLAVEIAKKKLGIRRSTGDAWALALPAGEAIGRIGCFFNECCFGVPTGALWACNQHGDWRHPTQIYLAISAAIIYVIVWKMQTYLPREGDAFKLYLALWGASRLAIEFWREREIAFAGLSFAQLACGIIAIIGAIGLVRSREKYVGKQAYFREQVQR